MGRTKPGVQNCSQPYPLLLGRFRPDFVQSRSAAVKFHGHLYQMLALAELHAGRSYGSLSDVVPAALEPFGRGRRAEPSDRLVGLGCAVVFGLGAPAVDDGAAADRDAIGLGAQRFTHGRSKFSPDASGPARACGSCCGGETCTSRGYDVAMNTESSCSRTSRLTLGGGSGGIGSLTLARMNSGTGERLSAMPQPAVASAALAINAA
jgi:hypothetical protein